MQRTLETQPSLSTMTFIILLFVSFSPTHRHSGTRRNNTLKERVLYNILKEFQIPTQDKLLGVLYQKYEPRDFLEWQNHYSLVFKTISL